MDDAIPGIASIVHDYMDLPIAKLCGLLNQSLKVCVIEHVPWNGNGTTARLVYVVGDIFRFLWLGKKRSASLSWDGIGQKKLTSVNV